MTMRRARPRLGKAWVARHRGYDVYSVDSYAVRDLTEADEEFTNFAIHHDFPDLIPEREIWVEERLLEDEGLFFLANALVHLKALEEGKAEDGAYEEALEAERALRERLVGVKFRDGRPHKRVPARVYVRRYLALPDPGGPIQVRVVDGNLVRCYYRTDYTEGGHGLVYPWVPAGEIWVERALENAELPFIVAHEYIEMRLMREQGLGYDRAHAISAEVEYRLRKDRHTRSFLSRGGRRIARRDLTKLARPGLFEHVVEEFVRPRRGAAAGGLVS